MKPIVTQGNADFNAEELTAGLIRALNKDLKVANKQMKRKNKTIGQLKQQYNELLSKTGHLRIS